MKFTCALLSLLAFAVPIAHADTLLFSLTDGTNNISFNLETAPGTLMTTSPSLENVSTFTNVSTSLNGGAGMNTTISFLQQRFGGGLVISGSSSTLLYQLGDAVFTGPVGTPTFVLGTYQLSNAEVVQSRFQGNFSLTISDLTPPVVPAAVTPEPSSLLLLGTGALSLAGVVRRRVVQAIG